MDNVTRVAMAALRSVSLPAAPATRGSAVRLRAAATAARATGTAAGPASPGLAVLVEGDDMDDPIATRRGRS